MKRRKDFSIFHNYVGNKIYSKSAHLVSIILKKCDTNLLWKSVFLLSEWHTVTPLTLQDNCWWRAGVVSLASATPPARWYVSHPYAYIRDSFMWCKYLTRDRLCIPQCEAFNLQLSSPKISRVRHHLRTWYLRVIGRVTLSLTSHLAKVTISIIF